VAKGAVTTGFSTDSPTMMSQFYRIFKSYYNFSNVLRNQPTLENIENSLPATIYFQMFLEI
jgi:hypothetical protein